MTVDESGRLTGHLSGEGEILITGNDGSRTALDVHVQKWADAYDPIAIAHRGASGYKPDNTIAAFRHAIRLDADMIELDVMKTADGEIICFHDLSIEYKGKTYSVSKLTLEQMRIYDNRICTLEEALEVIADSDILLQVELKASGIEKEVVGMVKAAGMRDKTCYGCFTLSVLKKIRTIDPAAKLVYITNLNSTVKSVIANPDNFDIDVMSIRKDLLSEARIAKLHLAGKQVYGWTIDSRAEISKYGSMGLDGVISNFPDRV